MTTTNGSTTPTTWPPKSDYDYAWNTIAVVPIPLGWVNVYLRPDGTTEAWPCPAILLMESTADYRDDCDNRAVYAKADGIDLLPADWYDGPDRRYQYTITQVEFEQDQSEKQAQS